jgi:hypothetical protein
MKQAGKAQATAGRIILFSLVAHVREGKNLVLATARVHVDVVEETSEADFMGGRRVLQPGLVSLPRGSLSAVNGQTQGEARPQNGRWRTVLATLN